MIWLKRYDSRGALLELVGPFQDFSAACDYRCTAKRHYILVSK